jgi:hypothetical protein
MPFEPNAMNGTVSHRLKRTKEMLFFSRVQATHFEHYQHFHSGWLEYSLMLFPYRKSNSPCLLSLHCLQHFRLRHNA